MSRPLLLLSVVLGFASLGCGSGGSLADAMTAGACLAKDGTNMPTRQVPDARGLIRYIVHYKDGHEFDRGALTQENAEVVHEFATQRATSVRLTPQAAQRLAQDETIASIEEDAPRFAFAAQSVPAGLEQVQAPQVWGSQGSTTKGVKTCIIDSGIHVGHADLQRSRIVGFPSDWSVDRCGHGTHVAGTIAALDNAFGVVGVVKNGVDLVVVKIFDDECKQTSSSDLVTALDQCLNSGARVVNLSLGGDRPTDLERDAFANAWKRGAIIVAAAGNEGTGSLQYPASYASVISVGAAVSPTKVADFSQRNGQVDLVAPGVSILSTSPFEARHYLSVGGARYDGYKLEGSKVSTGVTATLVSGGLCGSAQSSWKGNIVLCARGSYSFSQKVTQVQQSGALAAIIYNNEAGNFSGTLGTTSTIPAISISQEDGLLAKASVGSSAQVVNEDITSGSGYLTMSGTSMASPHVAGVASLVWGELPTATNSQVRAALEGSALDMGVKGRDDESGLGMVQAKAAVDLLKSQGLVNSAPQAAFSARCVGQFCSFASTSMDPDGMVLSYRFDLGDGTVTFGPSAVHLFKGPGPYPVTLTVTDDDGAISQITTQISVVGLQLQMERSDKGSKAKLTWKGVSESEVLVYRDGELEGAHPNSGDFEDDFATDEKAPTYQVCTRSLESCSSNQDAHTCQ